MSEERVRRNDPLYPLSRLLEVCCRSIRPPFDSFRAPPSDQLRRIDSYNHVVGMLYAGRSIRMPATTTMGQKTGSVHRPCQ